MPRSNLPYYGQSIGIIMLDVDCIQGEEVAVTGGDALDQQGFTRVPGDVGNASSFGFSVQYKLLRDLPINEVISRQPSEKGIAAMVSAAQALEREGVRAIATTCGLFSVFQTVLADAVDIPVVSSSLLQVPMVSLLIGPRHKVGIMTANSEILTEQHLAGVGINSSVPYVLWGANQRPADEDVWIFDELDPERRTLRLEKQLSLSARRMVEAHPDIGAIVLECTNMPPASMAIQKVTGLPVFDVISLIKWTQLAVNQQRYSGAM
jgi:Asp/Glu/hydantoin racemase